MNNVVLDASAILAVVNGEAGQEKLTPEVLAAALCSTVNLAEVQAKLVSRGWSPDDAWEDAMSPIRAAVPFSEEHARVAGSLVALTRALGLSRRPGLPCPGNGYEGPCLYGREGMEQAQAWHPCARHSLNRSAGNGSK